MRFSAPIWSADNSLDFAIILNLSEEVVFSAHSTVLEATFGTRLDSLALFAVLLARKNPYLSFKIAGEVDRWSRPILPFKTGQFSLAALQVSFARLVVLAERAMRYMRTKLARL